jgi:hypothetical protein
MQPVLLLEPEYASYQTIELHAQRLLGREKVWATERLYATSQRKGSNFTPIKLLRSGMHYRAQGGQWKSQPISLAGSGILYSSKMPSYPF